MCGCFKKDSAESMWSLTRAWLYLPVNFSFSAKQQIIQVKKFTSIFVRYLKTRNTYRKHSLCDTCSNNQYWRKNPRWFPTDASQFKCTYIDFKMKFFKIMLHDQIHQYEKSKGNMIWYIPSWNNKSAKMAANKLTNTQVSPCTILQLMKI